MNSHTQAISDELKSIYRAHEHEGILSIYLWGSILTRDYVHGTSDIDAIAIVSDEVPLELEERIQRDLSGRIEGVEKFGFRFLYLKELNGEKPHGNLASYIDPRLLLMDFENWMHVIGKKFARADFALPEMGPEDAISLHCDKAVRMGWTDVYAIQPKDVMYFLKNLTQTIYMKEMMKGNDIPFSYSELATTSAGDEHPVMQHILECKNARWDHGVFLKHAPEYQRYLDDIMQSTNHAKRNP